MRGGAQPQLRCESTPKPIRYLQDRSGTEKGQEQSCLLIFSFKFFSFVLNQPIKICEHDIVGKGYDAKGIFGLR